MASSRAAAWARIRQAWAENCPDKTVAGSVSVFLGGWLLSAFILAIYVGAGVFPELFGAFVLPLTIITFVSALVESSPLKDIDNITVTLAATVLGYFLF